MTRDHLDIGSMFAICVAILLSHLVACLARVAILFLICELLPVPVPMFTAMTILAVAWWGISNAREVLNNGCAP